MYTSLRIQNFRCFEDFQLNDLARINLIAGKNNTGKTSLLEAISILSGNTSNKNLFRYFPSDDWKLIYWQLDRSTPLILTGNFRKDEHEEAIEITIQPHASGVNINRQSPFFEVPHSFLSVREPVVLENIARKFSNLNKPFKQEVLIPALRMLEPRLVDLELRYKDDPPIVFGYIGLPDPIPVALMGEGIERVTSFILAIGSVRGGVVLIDEIENGLHYSALTDVWKAIALAAREFDVQIFATTHSLEMISAAHHAFSEDGEYDFRLHRLDRLKSGEIKAVTYDQEMLETARDANFEVR